MSSSGRGSRATFVVAPPDSIRVGREFPIIIQAPANEDNGSMGFLTLHSVTSRSSSPSEASDYVKGSLVGNWDVMSNCFDSMEFQVKVTRPGSYYLQIQLYSEPRDNHDGRGLTVEHLGGVESQRFRVREKSSSPRSSKR
ncbi:uncharacterized protein GGS22DRAFT_196005 [Annulohypoxylon maeteangense]|uniref:uncharacterized protein n=1 Tax=Annulohypoxylon maeteangense TaxID=1927788 RepID=UPI002008CE3E|nr:uncharacterized protein GGS22DRAFT_196005 [Annulohypoxylon maeteangense]KAI0882269.1 hypothetical protein GGS22DRAFT_196005 [Annulohypoxylon maeteangense]